MVWLCLLRHGQSQWNLENRFTGWVDIPLTDVGREEARSAAERLKSQGIQFDVAYASVLVRVTETLDIVLRVLGQQEIPVYKDKALNERHYGDLQGLNKAETAAKFGDDQVRIWRRSYDVPPPNGESLKDTQERALPYYQSNIEPQLKAGKNVLVVASGNSLRAIVMALEGLTPDQILKVELPTGVPWLYEIEPDLRVARKLELDAAATLSS